MLRSRARTLVVLATVAAVAATLRFWRLDQPPSWLDESVTALIAAGRGPDALPLGRVVPMRRIVEIFDPRVGATVPEALAVFRDPRVQDLHPPTFHLLSNLLLRAGAWPSRPLVARVRALAAVLGVVGVLAMFGAMRVGFDRRTSMTAAALVAVSPWAVMLSREARNYTAALMLATCAVGAVLALVRRIEERRSAALWWTVWAIASTAGLYVHYFTAFAFVAQAIVLAAVAVRSRSIAALSHLCASAAITVIAFVPWLPILISQQASPEQRWLTFQVYGSSWLEVPYRIASAVQTMLFGKAWDLGQPAYDITRTISLLVYLCVIAAVARAVVKMSSASPEERAVRLLMWIAALTMLEYVGAMVLQRKDFVSEVRYQYAYYVPLTAVIAWVLARRLPAAATVAVVGIGLINSAMVALDVESWKGTDPQPVVARLAQAVRPALIVAGSGSFNETVVHETVLFEYLRRNRADNQFVAVVRRTPLYASLDIHSNPAIFWRALAQLRPDVLPVTVMVQSANMRPTEYQRSLTVTSANGQTVECIGIGLDDPGFAEDNALIRPLYRRYACGAATAASGR